MRTIPKILKVLLITTLLLVLLVGGFVFSVLKWPHWYFNPKTFRYLAKFSSYLGAVVDWKDARIEVASPGLLHKSFYFGFDDLCFNFGENAYQGCLPKAELAVELAWLQGEVKILSLGPIKVEDGNVSAHLTLKSQSGLLDLDVPELLLPERFRLTVFRDIHLNLKALTLWDKDKVTFAGGMDLAAPADPQGHLTQLKLQVDSRSGASIPEGTLEAQLDSASGFLENDWVLQAKAAVKLSGKTADAELKMHQVSPKHFSLQLNGGLQGGGVRGKFNLDASLGDLALKGRLSGEATGFGKPIKNIHTNGCNFDVKQMGAKSDQLHLNLDCPMRVDLTPLELPSSTYKRLVTIPQNVDFNAKLDVAGSLHTTMDAPVKGSLNLDFATISQEFLNAKGKVEAQFDGVPSRYPAGWNISTDLDLAAQLPSFHKVAVALDKTAYPVPAPLYPLDGQVTLKLSGRADIAKKTGKLPIVFETRLKSKDQSFNTDGKGELTYQMGGGKNRADVQMEILLSDLKISLPRYGYSALPNLFPDPRLKRPEPESRAKKNENLSYQISVKTEPDHPARLFSNLAKENIPLILDLKATPDKLDGSVSVGATELNFFRRNAKVQDFKIVLAEPRDNSTVTGNILVAYTDYKISIRLLGTVARPRIIFESDPPLDQEQIISVLIYGRTYDALDSNQANSVSSVSSAAADRAIALGSLFLLASTPIESVGYNPATGAMTAKIRLAEGTSLNVGTMEGKTQEVGLRKNLGKNWIINTYIENNSQTGQQKAGAAVEWYKRY